jgi:hexokinase
VLIVISSLVEFYPQFEAYMRRSLRAIVGPDAEKLINIGMAKDGSGVGGEYQSASFPN